jgi:putative hemin transport protein
VSEAELVATRAGEGVTRLEGRWIDILRDAESLGEVMALTRNDACVHEKTGQYRNVKSFDSHKMGLVLDEQIDLRLFLDHWHFGFAVETPWAGAKDGIRRSLQFFDADGTAVHKIFLTRKSNQDAYDQLVARYERNNESPKLIVEPLGTRTPETPDREIDVEGVLEAWDALIDTHDFFPMLQKFGVGRLQALRLAEGVFTERAKTSSARLALQQAVETETAIMVFAGSPGCIQIHTGEVKKLKEYGLWFNVLDPGFNLHLNEELIETAWIVQKPTKDGPVTSLELYDQDGEMIVQFFGKRKPGRAELDSWRDILQALPRLG